MNSQQLQFCLEKLIDSSSFSFMGVFPRDLIPNLNADSRFPCCFLVNSDPSTMLGTHWLAFYFSDFSTCDLIDSYASHPSNYSIVIRSGLKISTNQNILQSLDSFVCGHYCVYFLYQRSRGLSYKQILSSFDLNDCDWTIDMFLNFCIKHSVTHPHTLEAAHSVSLIVHVINLVNHIETFQNICNSSKLYCHNKQKKRAT